MPTFRYDKLVRDNIVQMHHDAGHSVVSRSLTGSELRDALIRKLHEEADEVHSAADRTELIEEIADVQQIIEDLCVHLSISQSELLDAQTIKKNKKGGFASGSYIETVTMPQADQWVAYCRANPTKYPEITR